MNKTELKTLIKDITEDKKSCFDPMYIFEYREALYESLPKEHFDHKYRVIKDTDDYDYCEDEKLIARLDEHMKK